MLLWAGFVLIVVGLACFAVDRKAAHLLYDHINEPFFLFLDNTTHWAKGGNWLIAAAVVYVAAQTTMHFTGATKTLKLASEAAVAFVVSLAIGSIVLHSIKTLVSRRRPRDDMEMGLYGFEFMTFDQQYNSFPSGHALTIMCVAVVAMAVWPMLWPLWIAIALWLGLTRALLTAHFLSDVFVGAGIGLLASRETILLLFPHLAPAWF